MTFLFGKSKNTPKLSSDDTNDVQIGSYQPENPFSNIIILPAFKSTVTQIYVTSDKKQIVVGDEKGNLSFWDSKFATKIIEIKFHTQAINSITELNHGDKKILAVASNDRIITVWDIRTYKLIAKTSVGSKIHKIFEADHEDDEFFFAASSDLKIFDFSLNILDQFPRKDNTNTIRFIILINKTKIVLATNTDIEFYLLFCYEKNDLISKKIRIKQLDIYEDCHSDTILCLDYLQDQLFASGSSDGIIFLWNVDMMEKLMEIQPFEQSDLSEVFFKSDFFGVCSVQQLYQRYLIIASGLNLSIFDNVSKSFIFKIVNSHNGSKITNLLMLENSLLVTGAENGSIRIWKFQETLDENSVLSISLRLIGECLGQSSSISILKTISKKEIISTGYDNTIIIWRDSIYEEMEIKHEINEILSKIDS